MSTAQAAPVAGAIPFLTKNSDLSLAGAVVCILLFMVMPVPTFVLDMLLAFSISFSLIILLVAMYVQRPLELSSFPSILLLSTLFRLSLNIATTRVILLNGHEGVAAAGSMIKAFGSFVVGGNYVVGFIVFVILVVINFAVITKGAGRIAEVAARFTLDAMPGKQMSIDADLNAGFINEQQARTRREELSREAEYYGAMDGANKFVRGDAVAGIIITLVNVIGGLAIGVFQRNLNFTTAAQNYTLLTVGDGLVTQIPALVISTAAGIIVSRAGNESSLGAEITSQVFFHPRAMSMVGVILAGFAVIPGLPALPFLVLSALAGGLALALRQTRREAARIEEEQAAREEKALPAERIEALPPLDALAIEVGYALIPLVDAEQNGELLGRIKTIRRQMALDVGVIIPPVHIQDNMQLNPGAYSILLKGNEIARGELMPGYFLAMNPGGAEGTLEGVPTREPTYGLPATWIRESGKEAALSRGFTVVDTATIMTTHLSEVIRRHAHELIGRQEVQQMLDHLKQTHPKVVDELVPNLVPLGLVVRVLQQLLREQVPIRDLLAILETLGDWAPHTKDPDALCEHVRRALARTLTRMHAGPDGSLAVITLSHGVEAALSDALQKGEHGRILALDPAAANRIMQNLARHLERCAAMNVSAVAICSAGVRAAFKKLTDRFIPNVSVLSYDEVLSQVDIRSMGSVELSDAD
ncbi:MAG: flagellar biosynthesis protein FlhA [Desulfobacterales bacterium]|nr:flagellar biosynthesis protein FlhA [Desulfobacterales bacterium]